MLIDPNEGISRRSRRPSETLMGSQEPNYAGKFLGLFWDERRRVYSYCAHR
jgi:hypothetical protein